MTDKLKYRIERITTPELFRRVENEDREIKQLYWDCLWMRKQPDFVYTVEEIAVAYGFTSGRQLRREVDLTSYDTGATCVDCSRALGVQSRDQFKAQIVHPKRCAVCEAKAKLRWQTSRKTITGKVIEPQPEMKEAEVPNVSTVMSGEAAIHTIRNGTEIELRLPNLDDGQEYPPMMKLLAAIVHRADEEHGWWEDQVRWFDSYMREKRFAKTRMQLRLVSDNDKPSRK